MSPFAREIKRLFKSSDGFVIHLTLTNGEAITIAPYDGVEGSDDWLVGDLCGDGEDNSERDRIYIPLAQIVTARFEEL